MILSIAMMGEDPCAGVSMPVYLSIDDEIKASRKLHKKPSPAFEMLENILDSRHQLWCVYGQLSTPADGPLEPFEESDLRLAIHQLSRDELARALVRACVHGDPRIAKTIWSARGPFEINYEKDVLWTKINGTRVSTEVNANHILTNAGSTQEIEELIEWMPTVGLGFMVGVGSDHSVMIQAGDLARPIKALARKHSFEGELPTLCDGIVSENALLLAMRGKILQSHYPSAYEDLLCWVSEDMFHAFSDHLRPYKVVHGLTLEMLQESSAPQVFPFSDCTESLLDTVESKYISQSITCCSPGEWAPLRFDMRTVPAVDGECDRENMVLGHLGSLALQHGFGHKSGHVLCQAKASFLCQFDQGPMDLANYERALSFTAGYFPLDLVAFDQDRSNRSDGVCVREDIGFELDFNRSNRAIIRQLYQSFGDSSPIKDYVRVAISRPMIDFLLQYNCDMNMDVDSMIALNQAVGIDNAQLGMALDHNDLRKLQSAGFRFSDSSTTKPIVRRLNTGELLNSTRESSRDTDVYLDIFGLKTKLKQKKPSLVGQEDFSDSYSNALQMNLWPAEKYNMRPKSLGSALTMLAGKKKFSESNHDQALLAYVELAGIEACAKAAKNGSHWEFLRHHFGRDAIEPHMKLITREVRGRILEDDLGL